ncbi:MAG: NADH-quinone oxidoreductase subunit M [Ferruginibacter sp.]|nr:NADH-quinone oxidoreductase subunit M [Ferruginibacter sp.]
MLGTYITFPELLIWIPLLAGILCFFIKEERAVKAFALIASVLILAVSAIALFYADESKYPGYNQVSYYWLKYLGNAYHLRLDSIGLLLSFLTALSYPLIFLSSYKQPRENAGKFFGLMLLTQAGILGVFSAYDALMFYFFWELALVPAYFLCSMWGGERRVPVTFKFFVYTFTGSLLMLTGIIYVYMHTPERIFSDGTSAMHSFSYSAFQAASLSAKEQGWLFWLFFAAFAVKMPIFPFHTWQPDTYDQSATPVTMVLSGIMVKMGLFGLLRWLLPVFPEGVAHYGNVVMWLAVIGMVYASLIAMVQDNLKMMVAYSSIAHVGLMAAAILTQESSGLQGAVLQMFNHGINIIGLWIVVDLIERKTGVKRISELGGVSHKAPALTIFVVIIGMANIALPITNAFVGEFLMFSSLFSYRILFAVLTLVCIVLAAAYILSMIRKVFYGEMVSSVKSITDISLMEKIALSVIVLFIFVLGIYPQPVLQFTESAIQALALK